MYKMRRIIAMKKTLKLEGLDCANCAAKIESAVAKLDGVSSAALSFVTTKLVIEADETNMDAIVESTKSIVKKFEPDVVVQPA